ncbi:hypothetical protein D3C71_1626400 [compost metagenome]
MWPFPFPPIIPSPLRASRSRIPRRRAGAKCTSSMPTTSMISPGPLLRTLSAPRRPSLRPKFRGSKSSCTSTRCIKTLRSAISRQRRLRSAPSANGTAPIPTRRCPSSSLPFRATAPGGWNTRHSSPLSGPRTAIPIRRWSGPSFMRSAISIFTAWWPAMNLRRPGSTRASPPTPRIA